MRLADCDSIIRQKELFVRNAQRSDISTLGLDLHAVISGLISWTVKSLFLCAIDASVYSVSQHTHAFREVDTAQGSHYSLGKSIQLLQAILLGSLCAQQTYSAGFHSVLYENRCL